MQKNSLKPDLSKEITTNINKNPLEEEGKYRLRCQVSERGELFADQTAANLARLKVYTSYLKNS